ncbi:MAG: hypothetical protein A2051_04355 [Desulfovibrionales bacterium GWA2_65_9]|nr:MAG: hypothetical protein A2051_04355 [Desulfovibrionales bacterium GWA2_65_9]
MDQIARQSLFNTQRLAFAAGSVVIFAVLFFLSTNNFLLFHTLAEFFTVIISCCVFLLVWNTAHHMTNRYLLIVGIACLNYGFIDLLHALSYKGMMLFGDNDPNLPTQLWIAARILQSISMLVAGLFLKLRFHRTLPLITFVTIAGIFVFIIFQGYFPDCFIEGSGLTPFKKYAEYIICIILATSIYLLYENREAFDRDVYITIIWSLVFTALSELAFTFYVSVYGFSNFVGHCIRIAASYLLYKAVFQTGLVKPYAFLFQELGRRERALLNSQEHYRLLFDQSPVGIMHFDERGTIVDLNLKFAEIIGAPKERILGFNMLRQLTDLGMIKAVQDSINGALGSYEGDYTSVTGNNTTSVKALFKLLQTIDGVSLGGVAIFEDITERKRAEKVLEEYSHKLEALSASDGLTGIANRRRFDEVLALEYARHTRSGADLSLILLDIDYFKAFNDIYGHVAGDECLRQLAHVLEESVSRPADLAARYGGEEFACILPETNLDGAVAIAEKIRLGILALALPHKGSNVADYVSASFGVVAVRCTVDGTLMNIVRQVDELLYQAKACGRNQIKASRVRNA